MRFIKQYFNLKIESIKCMFGLIVDAWECQIYAASILMVLYTIICIILGCLLMPLDILGTVIAYWILGDSIQEILQKSRNEIFELQEES